MHKKSLVSEAAKQPGKPLTKEDTALIAMSAGMLNGLMNGMELDAGKKGKLVITFHTDMFGKKEDKTETLTYVWKDDHTLTTTDAKNKQTDLTIVTLNEKEFVFTGLGAAKTMQLHFKRM